MSSVREQALVALQTRLQAMSGVTVEERNHPEPSRLIDGAKLVALFDGACTAWSMEEGETGAWESDATPIVQGFVATATHADLMAACDALHLQVLAVCTAAFADKLGIAGVRSVDIGACEFSPLDHEGHDPAMTFAQQITLGLAVRAGDPSTGLGV